MCICSGLGKLGANARNLGMRLGDRKINSNFLSKKRKLEFCSRKLYEIVYFRKLMMM